MTPNDVIALLNEQATYAPKGSAARQVWIDAAGIVALMQDDAKAAKDVAEYIDMVTLTPKIGGFW